MLDNHHSQTMRGILKRKFAEVEKYPCYSSSSSSSSSSSPSSLSSPASSEWESDGEGSSSENQDFTPHSPASPSCLPTESILKRPKLTKGQSSVHFDQVMVYSFPRCQGFTSVPSRGGATLGMMRQHSALRRYTVAEHALEQRNRRRERHRDKLRQKRFEALKRKLVISGAVSQHDAERLTVDQVVDEDDAELRVSDSELEDGGFLQPISSKQRQALLQAAGVKVDKEEKRQLHGLRLSREACGCDCQGFCEPETCACSLAGIKCQVDRFNFPCGCTKDSCWNTQGRFQFDARRVRTHYIHTVMRLDLERRLHGEALSPEDQTELPEELQELRDQDDVCTEQSTQDKRCPFGYSLEEDGLPLTMPTPPSFHCVPDRLAVEENSCSSDTSESSCDSDVRAFLGGNPPEADGALSCAFSRCDSRKKNCYTCNHLRNIREPPTSDPRSTATDGTGPRVAIADNMAASSTYLDENANQSRDFFEDDSLEDFPHTPSPTVDYSFSRYMDLSLSSDSDLEFFHRDYPSGPLHSSFKEPRHSDGVQHLQLFSSVYFPQQESSTHLLESLIGLTEPSCEHADTQLS
ncbi:cysteine/serine-rich nuclear protein 1 [Kryptolebias marmoratus]|uniref:Cysteine-serine-rich nuclear protein 1a n=1 Tax=Kryptolebias marmoratus TaxID=37003 RepID=A0A3Q3B9K5_KRYMA|nr:cysteine/serine-rich nuclear protein 1 [Kryptolebias marmoratus]XP_037838047.1 cysteine/serine-rich nuclear protein 1 [Kryptolebias marmoratus]